MEYSLFILNLAYFLSDIFDIGILLANSNTTNSKPYTMIDTHCHIYSDQFDDDISEVLDRAADVGITDILMPAIDFSSREAMKKLHHARINFHEMAGIHPCDVKGKVDEKALWSWAESSEIIGIGESGLDYYWSKDHISEQKASLRLHCAIAKELDKPLVIHNRDSTADMLDIIAEEQDGRLRGVWHCYTGTIDEGKKAIDIGFHLGIGGVVTFKNGGVDKSVAELPLESLILETDAPYLAPVPHRGKRNEPSYTQLVGIKLSSIFEKTLTEIDEITTHTAKQLFRIP